MTFAPSSSAPNPPLAGRHALVTGSTGGIGLAVARHLAVLGCAVTLHGLETPEAAEEARRTLAAATGVAVRYCRADLAHRAEVEALAAEAGPLDILVNNAACRHFGAIETMPPEAWEADLAVNLSAAFHLIRLALPGMRAAGFGRIVNMSSIYGLIGAAGRVGYVTTKTALIGLTRAVAAETAGAGITCNALCPGTTLTPNIEGRIAAAMAERGLDRGAAEAAMLAGKQPTGRFIAADAVGAMVAFLCGAAARDITGATLPMDGGWSVT